MKSITKVKAVTVFKPSENRYLILADPAEELTKGGIIIPDNAKEAETNGVVVAVGPGMKDSVQVYNLFDRIMYGKFSGTPVNIEGKEYMIMRQTDIWGLWKDGDVKKSKIHKTVK